MVLHAYSDDSVMCSISLFSKTFSSLSLAYSVLALLIIVISLNYTAIYSFTPMLKRTSVNETGNPLRIHGRYRK